MRIPFDGRIHKVGGGCMKHSVTGLLSMLLVLAAAATCAGDTLGIYSDNRGMSCNIVDTPPGLRAVYVVHFSYTGATGSRFVAPKPPCWASATWLSDTTPYCGGVGCRDSQTGITLVYGACKIGAIHVLTINYFSQGSNEACCLYPLLPHRFSPDGQVEVVDCQFASRIATGLTGTVNGNVTCPCGYPVPVEETTWGRVKSLYIE
jgi:hypothetical protein